MSEVQNSQSSGPSEPATAAEQTSLARTVLVKIPHLVCGMLLLTAIAINIANVVGRVCLLQAGRLGAKKC